MRNVWVVMVLMLLACGPDVPKISGEVTARMRADVEKEMGRIDAENAKLVRFYPWDPGAWAKLDTVMLLKEDRRHLVGTAVTHWGVDTFQTRVTVVVNGNDWVVSTMGPIGGVVRYAQHRTDILVQQIQMEASHRP